MSKLDDRLHSREGGMCVIGVAVNNIYWLVNTVEFA